MSLSELSVLLFVVPDDDVAESDGNPEVQIHA